MKMNASRARELLVPLQQGTAEGISVHWRDRLIEALEFVIEHDAADRERIALERRLAELEDEQA